MELKGTVLNVVDFGAFVDIGLKDSGLVHISQLANRYVKSPHDVVSVGDVVDGLGDGRGPGAETGLADDGQAGHRASSGPARRGSRGGPGGEPQEPNREREIVPGHRARDVAVVPAAAATPRPAGSALTSPPVGAPSVAVLAETPITPARSRSWPRPGARRRSALRRGARGGSASATVGRGSGPGPGGGPPGRTRTPIWLRGWPAGHVRSDRDRDHDRGPPRGRRAARLAHRPRLLHCPRMPWPATSRSGRSASSSSSGKPEVEGPPDSTDAPQPAADDRPSTAQDQTPHPSEPSDSDNAPVSQAEMESKSNPA